MENVFGVLYYNEYGLVCVINVKQNNMRNEKMPITYFRTRIGAGFSHHGNLPRLATLVTTTV